jgi:uncharacterized surface protein with fasciclin (FAS1) repeats
MRSRSRGANSTWRKRHETLDPADGDCRRGARLRRHCVDSGVRANEGANRHRRRRAPMYPSKNIIQNAMNSKDHTTLVAAVKAAGLVETLQGSGPFTVFAPTNAAFQKLPAGTVDSLLKPQMKEKLVAVLTYHVLPGRLSVKDLWEASNKGGGKAKFKTVEGEELTVEFKGQALTIRDAKGNASRVTIQNVFQSNGVIHVIDSVLMPS